MSRFVESGACGGKESDENERAGKRQRGGLDELRTHSDQLVVQYYIPCTVVHLAYRGQCEVKRKVGGEKRDVHVSA